MPEQRVNGAKLFYELAGSDDPLVLVHGSWVDHTSWQFVAPDLKRSFQVFTYDRRGHSLSERALGLGSRREDEEDLAALMEALNLAPAHIVGNSFGGSIALGLAARRPDLFRSLIVHEAPLMGLVADDAELRPLMMEVQGRFEAVLAQFRAGDIAGGTKRFVEEIALGPRDVGAAPGRGSPEEHEQRAHFPGRSARPQVGRPRCQCSLKLLISCSPDRGGPEPAMVPEDHEQARWRNRRGRAANLLRRWARAVADASRRICSRCGGVHPSSLGTEVCA